MSPSNAIIPSKKVGMMSQKVIMLIQKGLKRLKVIQEVINKHITQKQASENTFLFKRQIIMIVKRIKQEGDRGIIHKLRERSS